MSGSANTATPTPEGGAGPSIMDLVRDALREHVRPLTAPAKVGLPIRWLCLFVGMLAYMVSSGLFQVASSPDIAQKVPFYVDLFGGFSVTAAVAAGLFGLILPFGLLSFLMALGMERTGHVRLIVMGSLMLVWLKFLGTL